MTMALKGFKEPFKVRASEAKDDFPTRHEWDSFFRDAKNMDEMKSGERPDTIHIANLPVRWFCPRHQENDEKVKPSENIFKRIFEKFGSVRVVDIPICDIYRNKMKNDITGMKTYGFNDNDLFEGYVQFSEYLGFVRAMDSLRSMKLVRKCVDKNLAINIHVTFDKYKHLSEANIKRRNIVRDRLIGKEKSIEEDEKKRKLAEEKSKIQEREKIEQEKRLELQKQREREERRKEKHLKKLQAKGQLEVTSKIRREQRKLIIAQRKVESIRILDALFERIRIKESLDSGRSSKKLYEENFDRLKLVNKYKQATEELFNQQQKKLDETKSRSSLRAILKKDNQKSENLKSKEIDNNKERQNELSSSDDEFKAPVNQLNNPFKSVCTPEIAAEWLKMNIMAYPPIFPGIQMYPPVSYRGGGVFRGSRGRFRGRGRSSYYSNYDDDGNYTNGYRNHRSKSSSRSRSKSKSRSRSSPRSYDRYRRRTRSRSFDSRHNRNRRSRSRERSTKKTTVRNGKLCSTRRSRSSSGWSRSKSRSRSWSKGAEENANIVREPEKIVKSAKGIQRIVQEKLAERLRDEESKLVEDLKNDQSIGREDFTLNHTPPVEK
ncbi:AKAP17A family protein [Megaselia abdita]